MYGPKPPAARRLAHPLADGGLVARMKSADAGPAAFGSRGLSQLRDLIPKMEAMGYKQQPQSFAKGGMIRGPGTGTSDSIPDEMAPGTYILPADTTEKLALDDKKVPVRVSNGEYELPPEQVQAVGAAVLDAIKGVTHTPKSLSARGLKSANGEEQAFSGGGPVRREEGGGLSKEAVMAAIAKQASQQQPAQQQPAARGIAGLATDFLRNPGGILAQRERQAGGYADGGPVRRPGMNMDEWAQQQEQQRTTATREQEAMAAAAQAGAAPSAPETSASPAATPLQRNAMQTAMYVRGAQEAAATRGNTQAAQGRAAAGAQSPVGMTPDQAFSAGLIASPKPVGYDPKYDQRLTGASAAPAAPSTSPSTLYMQDRAQELKDQVGQGNYAQAAGTAARTAVQGLGMYGIELADKAGTPLINAARGFGSGLLGSDANATPATPSTTASPPTSQTNPAAAPASTSLAGAGRGTVNPPMANPSAPAPTNAPAAAPEVMPGVYRHGRGQYSDNAAGMGMPAGFTGQPSTQNMAAADALAARSQQESLSRVQARGFAPSGGPGSGPVEPGSFTGGYSGVIGSTSTYGNMRGRSPEQRLRDAEVSASSIMNRPQWGGRGAENSASMLEYRAALAQDANIRQNQAASELEAMRQNAGITREGMQQDGATTRTGMTERGANAREQGRNILARDEFNLRKEASGFQTRAAQQQEQLRNVLLDPKSTPEQRAVAQRNLSALSGKTAADRMQTVTLPDTTNEMGQVVRGGQALVRTLEDGTVQQVPIGAQQGTAVPPGMTKQVGTSNGRPVYEDAKGNRFVG